MPVYAHLVAYAVARNMYGPVEARRRMSRLYGFTEANPGSARQPPGRDGWTVKIGRHVSAIFAASLALLS